MTEPRVPGRRRVLAALLLGCGAAAALVVSRFDPAAHARYPECLFLLATGWQCPGCGSLRAVHELIHGHLLEAARLNPAMVLCLPVLGRFVFEEFRVAARGRVPAPRIPARGWARPATWLLPVAFLSFWVLRNLG